MSDWIDVIKKDEFNPGDTQLVNVDDIMVGVFNLNGEYYAIADACTHDGTEILGCGEDPENLVEGEVLTCPHHGAQFCIRTGEALTPPAYEPLYVFPVRIQDGMIQVRDDRYD